MSWAKVSAMSKFKEALREGKVDKEIVDLLSLINSFEQYYTTSSCAGRIVLIELPELGDKESANILGKWHSVVNVEQVMKALEKVRSNGYLSAQSPIIHVACRTLDDAVALRNLAVNCGFKNSSIKSISKEITVEILSTERMDVPIARDGEIFPSREYLEFIVENANQCLRRGRRKLERLVKMLRLESNNLYQE